MSTTTSTAEATDHTITVASPKETAAGKKRKARHGIAIERGTEKTRIEIGTGIGTGTGTEIETGASVTETESMSTAVTTARGTRSADEAA